MEKFKKKPKKKNHLICSDIVCKRTKEIRNFVKKNYLKKDKKPVAWLFLLLLGW